MNKEIISVTIDGETYRKYKTLYEETEKNAFRIEFNHKNFYECEWRFYTKDEAIKQIAYEQKFIIQKHNEQAASRIFTLKQKIESLENEILELKQKLINLTS